jgi:nickel/cobalt transporter (NicO) family protein
MSLLAASVLGFGLGVKHALEADHLAAVCTFVARGGSVLRAAKAGALWGLGHAAVIVLAGGVLVLTGASVPAPIALACDLAVAAMLIGLGVLSMLPQEGRAMKYGAHDHSHAPRDAPHRRHPLAVGMVHGASGTAALTLLVASTINARMEALAFVTIFGLASVIGMAIVAALVAWPMRSVTRVAPHHARMLPGLAGAASIAAGLTVAWSSVGPVITS